MEYKTKISEEEIEELPNFTFDGEIIVIDHEDKIDAAVNDLSSYSHIGFDTETKPAFKKGVTHQVGLLQLATDKRVYLFRLNKCGLTDVKLGSPTIDPCTITLRSNRRMGGAKNVQGVKIRQQPATTSVLEFVK